jgi:hypothetical protein
VFSSDSERSAKAQNVPQPGGSSCVALEVLKGQRTMADFESASPALCRLQLGAVLRGARVGMPMTVAQVVGKLHWSQSKLHRLETADNATVEVSDVVKLCEMYGTAAEMTQKLKGYAEVTKTKKDWWQSPEYQPGIAPGFSAYLGLEEAASAQLAYENEFIPGLLQTEGYTRALHRRAHRQLSEDDVNREVAIRMTRQKAIFRGKSPLKLAAIVGQGVLLHQVGGAQVMREQLEHLVQVASEHPNVRLQVLPFRMGAHPGMNGPFMILQFRDHEVLKPIVYQENLVGAWVLRKAGDVARYEEAFEELQATALSPVDSVRVIKAAIKEH